MKHYKPNIICPYCGNIEEDSHEWEGSSQYFCPVCLKTSNLDSGIVYKTTKWEG